MCNSQVEGSDYINASYLNGHGRTRAYIATQVKGHELSLQGNGSFIPCRKVVLFSEVTNVLSLWEVVVLHSEVVLFSECPLLTVIALSC